MTVLMRQGRRVCNSRCHFAKGEVCKCICEGKFHGSVKNIIPSSLIKEKEEEATKEKEEKETAFRNWLKRKSYHRN